MPLLNAGQEVELAKRIEACGSPITSSPKPAGGAASPQVSSRTSKRVAARLQEARTTWWTANLRGRLAGQAVCRKGDAVPDLIQEGNMGLHRGVEKLNNQRVQFSLCHLGDPAGHHPGRWRIRAGPSASGAHGRGRQHSARVQAADAAGHGREPTRGSWRPSST